MTQRLIKAWRHVRSIRPRAEVNAFLMGIEVGRAFAYMATDEQFDQLKARLEDNQ